MIAHQKCPVCGNGRLSKIGQREMIVLEPPQNILQVGINTLLSYVLDRQSLTVITMMCDKCRHLFLTPSLDERELDRLYSPECLTLTKKGYRESEVISGKSWAEQNNVRPEDQESRLFVARQYRPKRLFELVTSVTKRRHFPVICDFGGSTGELTARFEGCRRYIFDKDLTNVTEAEVISISSFEELARSGPYDLIVLSHVLEHVPHPTALLKALHPHLTQNGVLYVEVPVEYCGAVIKRKGIPLSEHVNYFTRSSLSECLRSAGYERIYSIQREIVPFGECQVPVLKAIAQSTSVKKGQVKVRPWLIELLADAFLIWKARRRHYDFN